MHEHTGVIAMYQEIIENYTTQVEKFFAPVQQFARLSLSNGEKLYALQMEITQSYIDFGVEQMKALIEVKDPESLRAFVSRQAEAVKTISEKMIADTQAVAELGSKFNAESQQLARESVNAALSLAA